MTLHHLVRRLGGEVLAGGRRASIPAPGHSPADRSVSLLLSNGRLIIHGFGGTDWRAVRDHLRAEGLIDADGRLVGVEGPAARSGLGAAALETPGRDARRAVAAAIWTAAIRFNPDSPAGRLCAARATPDAMLRPWAIRFHAETPTAVYRPGSPTRPALICAVRAADGRLTAVEVTYLTARGTVSEWLRTPRKSVGLLPAGCAVRLTAPAADMLVGEGVFTTLSAMARFALPGWALMSIGNLRRWTPPVGVSRVLIAADRGAEGEGLAGALADRLRGLGLRAWVRPPPEPFGDWNDWARSEAAG